jgi:prepilin-type N-terminal cleavage/methylation domain-containing protein
MLRMMKYPDSLPSSDRLRRRERGFTLTEILAVIMIIGFLVTIGYPIMWRSLVRARLLSEVRMVKQATTVARIHAVKNGQPVTLKILDGNAPQDGGLLEAWVDTDDDGTNDEPAANFVGRWQVKAGTGDNGFTLSPASGLEFLQLGASGPARGVIFLPTGVTIVNAAGSIGVGTAAIDVGDKRSNTIRLLIRGGAGTVTQSMWNPYDSVWSEELRWWRY